MHYPTTLDEINATEDALRAVWARGDADQAADLRARLVRLWERERAERAQRRAPATAKAPAPLTGGKGPRWRGGR
jgi:hypothetical protein